MAIVVLASHFTSPARSRGRAEKPASPRQRGHSISTIMRHLPDGCRSHRSGNGWLLSHDRWMSQIVNIRSGAICHSLCVAPMRSISHTVNERRRQKWLPNNLKAWREFRELSQAALAEAIGTNANMIGYLESGERGLSAKWLRRLAPPLRTTRNAARPRSILLDRDLIEDMGGSESRPEEDAGSARQGCREVGERQNRHRRLSGLERFRMGRDLRSHLSSLYSAPSISGYRPPAEEVRCGASEAR